MTAPARAWAWSVRCRTAGGSPPTRFGTVVEEYVDNDLSAYRGRRRPRFEALLSGLEARGLDAVVTYQQDRLTRSPAEFEQFLAICPGTRVQKFTTVSGYPDLGQGDGVMVARIFAAVAAHESDTKNRRVRRKNDEPAAKGLPHSTGNRAFGYGPDRVTVRPDEAAISRACAERFLAGESIASLVGWLDEQGVTTATGVARWRSPTLRNLLKSPRIAGLREHSGGSIGTAAWPAIITELQHQQIVTKLNDPIRPRLRRLRQGLRLRERPRRAHRRRGPAAPGHPRDGSGPCQTTRRRRGAPCRERRSASQQRAARRAGRRLRPA